MKCSRRDWLCSAAGAAASLNGQSLFNGKDLAGWSRSANGVWTVEQGEIVGRCDRDKPGPGYLFTNQEYAKFTLELDFWISKGGNSGVFIRQPLRPFSASGDGRPGQRPDDGVEIQIDYNDPRNLTGSVYNLQKPKSVPGGEERWNRFRIEYSGSRVKVLLDGKLINDYDALKSPKGAIGLQIHGGRPHDHVVRFRNLVLI